MRKGLNNIDLVNAIEYSNINWSEVENEVIH